MRENQLKQPDVFSRGLPSRTCSTGFQSVQPVENNSQIPPEYYLMNKESKKINMHDYEFG